MYFINKKYRCKYVIIGHSERRINHCEKDEIVKKKIILAKKFKISAIVCVGEPLEIRKKRIIYHLFFINWIDVYQITLMKLLLLMNLFGLLGGKTPTLENILEIKTLCINFLKEKKKLKQFLFIWWVR